VSERDRDTPYSGTGWTPPGGPSDQVPVVAPPPVPPVQPVRPGLGLPLPPVPPPAGAPWRPPKRVEPVPGTPFAVAYLYVPQTTSGPAIGSLVAGIGSLLVTLLVGCFGLISVQANAGALVGGAFAVLALATGTAAIALGLVGLRQVKRAPVGGRGLAIGGIACGSSGIALALIVMLALIAAG